MLTVLENLRETMKADGHPDRFVNQFEFMKILGPDLYYMGDYPLGPGKEGKDQFGVLWRFPEDQMGAFPVHDAEHKVINGDLENWREKITHIPFAPPAPEYWGMLNGIAASTDTENQFVTAFFTQGIFERYHSLMGVDDALLSFYTEPDEAHALIDFLTECELDFAKQIMDHVPSVRCLFHHDDWGSAINSFMSPDMFDEFITPAYKKIYGYWHERGVEVIVHHSDSYAANLVPSMIEMGIDIWQGCFPSNNLPELIEKYKGQITFMGDLETRYLDLPDWTPEKVRPAVEESCRRCKGPSFIPCLTAGGNSSINPGVYECVSAEIDRMSKELF